MNEIRETLPKSKVSAEFTPSFGLKNRHLQTILSSVGPRKRLICKRFKKHNQQRTEILLDGGDGVRLQGFLNCAPRTNATKLVILIHGWEGSHDSTYMQSMSKTLLDSGHDVFRLNLRDHGETHHLNEGMFNSTLVDEVINAIGDLQSSHSYSQYHLVGFSLGGNFCVRVAAKASSADISLSRVIAFCPVIHAHWSNEALSHPKNRLYDYYFVRKWKRSLRKKLEHWPDYDFADELDTLKTLDQMNERLVPAYTPYSNLSDYFEAYAITGDRLAKTIAPCHLFFAEDDMIIPISGVEELSQNADVHVTITKHGGHCGYLKNWQWDCWQDEVVLDIIETS